MASMVIVLVEDGLSLDQQSKTRPAAPASAPKIARSEPRPKMPPEREPPRPMLPPGRFAPSRPGIGSIPLIEFFDSDGDGALSRREYQEATEEVFARLDANGDGKVDRSEMNRDLSGLFVKPTTRSRQLLRRYDQDHDGRISAEECLLPAKVFAELDIDKSGALESADLMRLTFSKAAILLNPARRASALLAELDKDGDKKLSLKEFALSKTAFQEADKNGDGQLDFAELTALPPLPLDSPLRRAEQLIAHYDENGDKALSRDETRALSSSFKEIDTNGNGRIETKELASWLQAGKGGWLPITSPTELADRTFDSLDRNGDGKLTKDETERLDRQTRQRWDANGDGIIEFEEIERSFQQTGREGFVADSPGGRDRPPHADLLRGNPAEIIRTHDQDGDGKVTAAELRLDARLFQRMDRDGDGKLTVEELAAGQDLIRGRGADIRDHMQERLKEKRLNKR
ncbi:EF-hand domain-containing protein [Candidatus Sumerlaeota bacterium]|nr:EF-hand domain-containing protein [Candidatus Sumerlaeota bacterium]